jgi:transposase-like protein
VSVKKNRVSSNDPGGAEAPKRTSGGASADRRPEVGRFSSRRKLEAVLRILRGETLDEVSRELGVTAATLAEWRDACLGGAQSSLKSRPADERDEEIRRLRAKIGEITMSNELLLERCHILEAGRPLAGRRPRR